MGLQLSKHEVHWVVGFETVQMCFNISFLLNSITACNNTHTETNLVGSRILRAVNINLDPVKQVFQFSFLVQASLHGEYILKLGKEINISQMNFRKALNINCKEIPWRMIS